MKKSLALIVSENLAALRTLHEHDTVTLGKRAAVSQKTVWNCLKEETCNPTLRIIETLAKALCVPPYTLLIDGAVTQAGGLPSQQMLDTMQRFSQLDPVGQRQVAEFIALWERSQAGG